MSIAMTSFLIEYNRRSGEVDVTPYDSTREAARARIAKTRTRASRDIEVVAVRSPSIEALRALELTGQAHQTPRGWTCTKNR